MPAHDEPKYSKNYRPVTIDMLQSNNQFNIQTFFDLQYSEGTPIYRYVDDMNVDWDQISKKMGRAPDECKSQYQYLLDTLFIKSQFEAKDRELLYRIITGTKTYSLKTPDQNVPEETLREIQQLYFPDYSAEVVKVEILAALENFKQFISENKPE